MKTSPVLRASGPLLPADSILPTASCRLPTARPRSREAFSYVELCLAILILGICIIPGAQALRSVLDGQQSVETRYGLSQVAHSKMEDAMRALQPAFAARSDQGDLTSLGHPDWYYDTLATISADKTYATVRARVWVDSNSNHVPDAGEPLVRFDTHVTNRFWVP